MSDYIEAELHLRQGRRHAAHFGGGMMATKKKLTERERFERWRFRTYPNQKPERLPDGSYLHWDDHFVWLGWQARAREKR